MYKLEKIKKEDVSKSGKIFFVLKEDKTEVYLSLGIMKNSFSIALNTDYNVNNISNYILEQNNVNINGILENLKELCVIYKVTILPPRIECEVTNIEIRYLKDLIEDIFQRPLDVNRMFDLYDIFEQTYDLGTNKFLLPMKTIKDINLLALKTKMMTGEDNEVIDEKEITCKLRNIFTELEKQKQAILKGVELDRQIHLKKAQKEEVIETQDKSKIVYYKVKNTITPVMYYGKGLKGYRFVQVYPSFKDTVYDWYSYSLVRTRERLGYISLKNLNSIYIWTE